MTAAPPAIRPRRWPWLVAAATLVVFVLANVLFPDADAELVWTSMFAGIILAFILVGALLSVRVPTNPVGPIILGSGALLATTVALGTVATVAPDRGDVPLPIVAIAAVLNDIGFVVSIVVVLIGVPLISPTGACSRPGGAGSSSSPPRHWSRSPSRSFSGRARSAPRSYPIHLRSQPSSPSC